ncbi:hypothetical protein BO78DRAFT_400013 [Aspergillus sclerotiicarbonarius CBS 121057]|uniref:Methyltransferase domain-containing protein n=1 Tax=Aspergillus sclerotiicarbonarius (strain CBS 121057 / IBT 28362) TaxID=1448318 RepID=A0A319DZJ1_ASPSB|nr:hypothetical protein BO78DRAFT_400013 [Aspergillus sclerotiicarbonarius CBS 121057]
MADVYAENLQRDAEDSRRLDEQFDLLTENLGYLIHPKVLWSLTNTTTPPIKIADLATGTARFLRRVADCSDAILANAILDGSDLSASQFPVPSSLPPNVQLRVQDVRAPMPREWEGRYDLVHVRQIAAGLTPEEWESVVANLARLLKPGGAMQWEECNFANTVHLRGGERDGQLCSVEAARTLGQMFKTGLMTHFCHGWDRLQAAMQAAGLERVGAEWVSSDRIPHTRRALTQNGMHVIRRWACAKAQAGRLLSVGEVQALADQADRDIESGCYVRFDIHAAWGFKPN